MVIRYPRMFSLNEKDETEFNTCLSKFIAIEILRLGIKEALKLTSAAPAKSIKKAKELIKCIKKKSSDN